MLAATAAGQLTTDRPLHLAPLDIALRFTEPPPASVQEQARRGVHAVGIRAGARTWSSESEISGTGITTETDSNGLLGSIGYEYFVQQELSIGVSLGVLDSGSSISADVGGISSKSATVTSILAGVTYYPEWLALGPDVRPYLSAAAGPYIGSATNQQVGSSLTSESISDVALGVRVGGGVDWFIGRRVRLGVGVGYHLVDDFDDRIGSTDDTSGIELSLGLSFLFGGGR